MSVPLPPPLRDLVPYAPPKLKSIPVHCSQAEFSFLSFFISVVKNDIFGKYPPTPPLGSRLLGDRMRVRGTLSPPNTACIAHTLPVFKKIILIGNHRGKRAGETVQRPRLRILGLTMIAEDYKN